MRICIHLVPVDGPQRGDGRVGRIREQGGWPLTEGGH